MHGIISSLYDIPALFIAAVDPFFHSFNATPCLSEPVCTDIDDDGKESLSWDSYTSIHVQSKSVNQTDFLGEGTFTTSVLLFLTFDFWSSKVNLNKPFFEKHIVEAF